MNPSTPIQTRRQFVRRVLLSTLVCGLGSSCTVSPDAHATPASAADLAFLREIAREVLDSARIRPGDRIPGGAKNTTGHTLRAPGGTLNYYPAFWIRDAAMMLGGEFVPAEEIEGWVRLIASTQPGADGLRFGRLVIPPYSIPDHITLAGEACWYPGAYAEQGNGTYGFLPPADDAFFFIQMVCEHGRLSGSVAFFRSVVKTGWGEQRLSEVCVKAFDSVAVDAATGLVVCESAEGRTRVDWGFCDSIRKTGLCLMPSLLRWRSARALAALLESSGNTREARRLRAEAKKIQSKLAPTFYRELAPSDSGKTGCLLSATELGRKDDVWASAFAIWLGVLPRETERRVARHLLALFEAGGIVAEGQVRHLPLSGELGGHWESALSGPDHYQNGGYWGTPTGWLIVALRRVNASAGDRLLAEYVAHLRAHRDEGAPWEWINPALNLRANPRYGSSAGLVSVSLLNAAHEFR
jgi:hypothetical protein